LRNAWDEVTCLLAAHDGYARRPMSWQRALPDAAQFYELICSMEEDGHEFPDDTLDVLMRGLTQS